MSENSTKPYLLRAIYEWCTDNGYTPHLAAIVDEHTRVPMQFVKNGEIVLNISFQATSGLKMDNDSVHFTARFGGVARDILVPVDNIIAIYARENGQGMAFEVSRLPGHAGKISADDGVEDDNTPASPASSTPALSAVPQTTATGPTAVPNRAPDDDTEPPKKGGRPTLTRIK